MTASMGDIVQSEFEVGSQQATRIRSVMLANEKLLEENKKLKERMELVVGEMEVARGLIADECYDLAIRVLSKFIG